jgi:hypothetical protein
VEFLPECEEGIHRMRQLCRPVCLFVLPFNIRELCVIGKGADKNLEKSVLFWSRLHNRELLFALELKFEFLVVAVRMDSRDVDARGKVHPAGVVGTNELVERHKSAGLAIPLARLPPDFLREAGFGLDDHIRFEEPKVPDGYVPSFGSPVQYMPSAGRPTEGRDDRIVLASPQARIKPEAPPYALKIPWVHHEPDAHWPKSDGRRKTHGNLFLRYIFYREHSMAALSAVALLPVICHQPRADTR